MPLDAQPAASSPAASVAETAVDQAVVSGDQAAFRAARRADRAGTPLVVSPPADSTPAAPVDQAASTDASPSPASEPGPPKKKNADSRVQELLAERAQLRAELEAAKRPAVAPAQAPDVPAASSPAPVRAKFPDYDTWATQQPADQQSYEDYTDARAVHVFQQQQRVADERTARAAADREQAERLTAYRQHAERFVADHPDYWTVIAPITQVPPSPTADATCDVIARSTNPPQLLYHLGAHLDDFDRILALPPAQATYELGKIDASLSASTPPVAVTPITGAPRPPTTLGRKAADPADATEAAVASGDMSRFKALKQRERLAQLR